jgi:hypothetical protein
MRTDSRGPGSDLGKLSAFSLIDSDAWTQGQLDVARGVPMLAGESLIIGSGLLIAFAALVVPDEVGDQGVSFR